MTNLKRLITFTRRYHQRMAGAVAAMVAVAASNAGVILLLGTVVDDGLRDDAELEFVLRLAAVIVILYFVLGIARYVSTYLMGSVGFSVVRDLRLTLYTHLQFVPLGFHARRTTGGLMSRVTSDVLAVQEAITRVLVDLMRESLTLVFLVGVMFYRDWVLSLITLVAAPLIIGLVGWMSGRLRILSRRAQQGLGEISALLHETLTGIRVVKAFCMEEAEIAKFRDAAQHLFRHSLQAQRLASISSPLMEFVAALAVAGVFVYGYFQISSGRLTTGELFSFVAAALVTYSPLRRLSAANVRIQAAAAAADRLYEILDEPTEAYDPATLARGRMIEARSSSGAGGDQVAESSPSPVVDAIRFESISFAYTDSERCDPVLHDVDLTIAAGTAVALVGPSGAGKSSLANLIPRFYEPTTGRVTIDGVDVRELRLEDLRARVAVVTQDTILFNDTLERNIAYGRPDVPRERLEKAAAAAFADEFIERLPDGYDTVLGERGLRLSGGQRQRIAIARALLKNAPILILDEATSSLDERSDRLVQEALVNLMEGRTTVIIAHRLSTIRHADKIVVIDKGRVHEQGTHEELLRGTGTYQELYSSQPSGVLS